MLGDTLSAFAAASGIQPGELSLIIKSILVLVVFTMTASALIKDFPKIRKGTVSLGEYFYLIILGVLLVILVVGLIN